MRIGEAERRRAFEEAERRRAFETEPSLMSRAEAARSLGGLHLQTIGKLARAGKLERVFVGRRSMVTVASVRALASGRTATTTVLLSRRLAQVIG
jgi:hypothetical protein